MKAFGTFILFLAGLSLLPANLQAETLEGPIRAEVIRILDGDTFDVRAQIWIGHSIETRIRLNNLDTPEIRGKCEAEKSAAMAAKSYLTELIAAQPVYLKNIHYGKFAGRVIASAYNTNGADLAAEMKHAGHGRDYDGGARQGWCPEERAQLQ